MSKFSERLNYLIKESGTNILQLAKKSGLERTTIQRSITGERIPKLEFVQNLCDYLQVSPKEKADLLELYKISVIGEDVYKQRQYIKEMIEQLSMLDKKSQTNLLYHKSVSLSGDINSTIKVFSGKQLVNNMLHDILEDEIFNQNKPQINLVVPFSYTYLFDCLRQLYLLKNGKVSINHIVNLIKNPSRKHNSNTNLEILSHAIPFAFYLGDGYRPYYHYANEDISDNIAVSMPYYLYTTNRLIAISADFNTAILYNNNDIKNLYHDNFLKCLSASKPFLQYTSNINEIIYAYNNSYDKVSCSIFLIEPQPCLAKYYSAEIIEEHLVKDLPQRETVRQAVTEFYSEIYFRNTPHLSIFFSLEGLEHLLVTGRITDLPSSMATPFTKEECKYFLESLRNDIQNEYVFSRAIISSKMIIPPCVTVQMSGENDLMIIITSDSGLTFSYINEVGICDAFLDFFTSLADSDLTYSKNETIAILDEAIVKLEQGCRLSI